MSNTVDRARVFGERGGAVERIAPGFFPKHPELEGEHVSRYRWAARRVHGGRVLDVACGTGYGAALLRDGGARCVLSLEYSLDALRFGQYRYGLRAVRADAHQLPFDDNTYDVVVCFETIEHLEGPDRFLAEIKRVLRRSGTLLISTPNATRTQGDNPYHLREYRLEELTTLLSRAGLLVVSSLGQRWRLDGWMFQRVRGFRRLAWLLERRTLVAKFPAAFAQPMYWCLVAQRP